MYQNEVRHFTTFSYLLLFITVINFTSIAQSKWEWRNPLPQGFPLYSVVSGKGIIVAVGSDGTILTSIDGTNWTARNSNTFNNITAVSYGNNIFVAAGGGSINDELKKCKCNFFTSSDGISWVKQAEMDFTFIESITYANNLFVAVGGYDDVKSCKFRKIFISSDGIHWSTVFSSQGGLLRDVCFGNNTFVAVGKSECMPYSNTGLAGSIFSSADGVSWVCRDSGNYVFRGSVIYKNGTFITPTTDGKYKVSTDGVIWSELNGPEGISSLVYENNQLLGFGSKQIFFSPDGDIQSLKSCATNCSIGSITFTGNFFVGVGAHGSIYNSSDGRFWTEVSSNVTTKNLTSVAFGNNRLVIAGYDGTVITSVNDSMWKSQVLDSSVLFHHVFYANNLFFLKGSWQTYYTSYDGLTWTQRTSDLNFTHIIYANGNFIALYGNRISTSTNGINWKCDSITTTLDINSVVSGNNIFVAIGGYGMVYTSSDGLKWEKQTIESHAPLKSITYGKNMFVAVGDHVILTSVDGKNWVDRTTSEIHTLKSVTFGQNHFVATGPYSSIFYSSDGITWIENHLGAYNVEIESVIFENGMFVAVGNTGRILVSKEDNTGISTQKQSQFVPNINKSFYSGNHLIASIPKSIKTRSTEVFLINLSGKKVYSQTIEIINNKVDIKFHGISPGLYFLSLDLGTNKMLSPIFFTK